MIAGAVTSRAEEEDAVARHVREHDRLVGLRVVEREPARNSSSTPNVTRLMTIPEST